MPAIFGSLAILVTVDFRPVGFAPPAFTGFALIVGMKKYLRGKKSARVYARAHCSGESTNERSLSDGLGVLAACAILDRLLGICIDQAFNLDGLR